jgi:putative phosphoribosyl transferase
MTERVVRLSMAGVTLGGDLTIPPNPAGIVLFAHGSGSGRRSPRNQFVARTLQANGLATLLLDLLTETEEIADLQTAHLRFDIPLLARRLVATTAWLAAQPETGALPLGYFGASTGAAAAFVAAAAKRDRVRAVVSRGGRPDLAGHSLVRVEAPTLLIVGGGDTAALGLNERAFYGLRAEKAMEVVAGATHLFEEPGALEVVARLAGQWFTRHLASSTPRARAVGSA